MSTAMILDMGAIGNPTERLQASLDACARTLGTHAPRRCADCGTFAEMALAAAGYEEAGRNVVPMPCAECGGWTLAPDVLRVRAACELVRLLAGGRAVRWSVGQASYSPHPAYRYAAILCADGVRVWRTNEDGWMDRYLGLIRHTTTRADVWRMRQQFAWSLAAEIGLVTR